MSFLRRQPVCLLAAISIAFAGVASADDASKGQQVVTRNTFRDAAKKVAPAVVNIKIKSNIVFGKNRGKIVIPPSFGLDDEMRDYLGKLFEQQMPNWSPNDEEDFKYAKSGSGVIIRSEGYLVTSNHVVAGSNPDDIEVSLSDGRTFDKVKIIGTDDLTDLAVLKVEGTNLPAIAWGDSEKLEVGDFVLAIGNPLEFNNSVSEGIVSAKHRVIKKAPIEDLIQTTAMINPGNSGGALVDLDSQLVGINMAIATSTGMWSGLGFAIPSKTAREITEQIIDKGRVSRGYLGIMMESLTRGLAHQLGYEQDYGIVVKEVRPNSAAEKAGLQRYDVIAKVNDREIKEINDMHRSIGARPAGDTVDLQVFREEGGSKAVEKHIKVQLDERPGQEELESVLRPKLPGNKPADKALLGLKVGTTGGKGVVVEDVEANSRAARAGIQKGDIILQVNKQDVSNEQDVQKALKSQTSDSHLLYIERKGQSSFVTITEE